MKHAIPDGFDPAILSEAEAVEVARLLTAIERDTAQKMFDRLFPVEDTLQPDGKTVYHARHKYPRHMEFFEAGARYRERCLMAANRVGKTVAGAYELTCHLTGDYPDWWVGRRFPGPIRAWAAGKTNETTRDIVQSTLMGEVSTSGGRKTVSGTGLIPGRLIGAVTAKAGVTDMLDTVRVRHVKGGSSILGFKSYQQGRGSFEGTAQHAVWLDEEPPIDIYGECLTRTATTGGILVLTFTPLDGLSETVMQFMPGERPGG